MTHDLSILLLAGSAEARQIAASLHAAGHAVHAVMSEPPRGANPMPVPFEVIADVDVATLHAALRGVGAVVDASHGFDGGLTDVGYRAAAQAGVPFVSYSRAPWSVEGHANWHTAPDVAQALSLVGAGARVFSATGWASLPDYAGFQGEVVMLRQTTRHDRTAPFDFVELVFGDPPFSSADEETLFAALKVDTLICRNLGGAPSRPKLDAAATLGMQVILIDRPPLPSGARIVHSVADALDWVADL